MPGFERPTIKYDIMNIKILISVNFQPIYPKDLCMLINMKIKNVDKIKKAGIKK